MDNPRMQKYFREFIAIAIKSRSHLELFMEDSAMPDQDRIFLREAWRVAFERDDVMDAYEGELCDCECVCNDCEQPCDDTCECDCEETNVED
jgi:hypothetical protein